VSSVAVIVFGVLAYWSSGILDKFTDVRLSDNERQTAEANESAAKANEGLAKATLEIKEREKENLQLENKLESEHKERLRLLEAAGPRIIEQTISEIILRRLEPVDVVIECPREYECQQLAEQVASLVNRARWHAVALRDPVVRNGNFGLDNFNNDIVVEGPEPHATQLARQISGRSSVRAIRLEATDLPPNTIRVKVYPKQGDFFIRELTKAALPPEVRERYASDEARQDNPFALSPDEQPTAAELAEREASGWHSSTSRLFLRREGSEEEKLFREAVEQGKKATAARKQAEIEAAQKARLEEKQDTPPEAE
jgi:hypothetical protein